jgi:hypothetical protein
MIATNGRVIGTALSNQIAQTPERITLMNSRQKKSITPKFESTMKMNFISPQKGITSDFTERIDSTLLISYYRSIDRDDQSSNAYLHASQLIKQTPN